MQIFRYSQYLMHLWSTKAELNALLEDSGLRRLPEID